MTDFILSPPFLKGLFSSPTDHVPPGLSACPAVHSCPLEPSTSQDFHYSHRQAARSSSCWAGLTLPLSYSAQFTHADLAKGFCHPKSSEAWCQEAWLLSNVHGLPLSGQEFGWSAYICLHLRDTGESLPGASKSPLCLVAVPQAHWTHLPATSQHSPPWLVPPPPAKVNPSGFQPGFRCRSCENNTNAAQII